MLLLLEIWLTVRAWRKGWKGYALLPIGVTGAVAVLTGFMMEGSGGSVNQLGVTLLLFDLCCLAALIMMGRRQPGERKTTEGTEPRVATLASDQPGDRLPAPQRAA